MLSAEKTEALKTFLSHLPEGAASRLAQAVEADWRAGGTGLPHEVILEALRPKLAAAEPLQQPDPFAELETCSRAIRNARPADFDAHALIGNLNAFATYSATLLKEVGVGAGDKRAQRLAKYRASVADMMDGFMERAPRAILAALPTRKIGGFGLGNPKPLDLSRPPDMERLAYAKRFAQLLVQSRPFAMALGFDGTQRPALEETVAALRRHGEDITREVRASTPETRARAEAHLVVALELSAIVLGKQEADLIRRQSLSS